jgi:cell division protein FtsB
MQRAAPFMVPHAAAADDDATGDSELSLPDDIWNTSPINRPQPRRFLPPSGVDAAPQTPGAETANVGSSSWLAVPPPPPPVSEESIQLLHGLLHRCVAQHRRALADATEREEALQREVRRLRSADLLTQHEALGQMLANELYSAHAAAARHAVHLSLRRRTAAARDESRHADELQETLVAEQRRAATLSASQHALQEEVRRLRGELGRAEAAKAAAVASVRRELDDRDETIARLQDGQLRLLRRLGADGAAPSEHYTSYVAGGDVAFNSAAPPLPLGDGGGGALRGVSEWEMGSSSPRSDLGAPSPLQLLRMEPAARPPIAAAPTHAVSRAMASLPPELLALLAGELAATSSEEVH